MNFVSGSEYFAGILKGTSNLISYFLSRSTQEQENFSLPYTNNSEFPFTI